MFAIEEKKKTHFWSLTKWLMVFAGFLIAIFVAANLYVRVEYAASIVVNTKIHMLNPSYAWVADAAHPTDTVYRGTAFHVHNTYSRSEVCYDTVSDYWYQPATEEVRNIGSSTDWHPIGVGQTNEYFVVPTDLVLGDWVLVRDSIDHCNGVEVYFTTDYRLSLKVVNTPEGGIAAPTASPLNQILRTEPMPAQ